MDLLQDCILKKLSDVPEILLSNNFRCEIEDLNDFLHQDAIKYNKELIGVTYAFVLNDNPTEIVCFFTVSNDGLNLNLYKNNKKKKILKYMPRDKHMRNYPAVKIGRLGVDQKYSGKGVGRQLMDFIKGFFVYNNKTGCRYAIVDSYIQSKGYYEKQGFVSLVSDTEKGGKSGNKGGRISNTELMFFDLKLFFKL